MQPQVVHGILTGMVFGSEINGETGEPLGASVEFEVSKIKDGKAETARQSIATEVPCTIVINGKEAVTAMVTPTFLKEFAAGHLFTAGIINSASDIKDYYLDERKWRLDIKTTREVDLEMLGKRVYTSGCGKGVIYANVIELSSRHPLEANLKVRADALMSCMKWLMSSSTLYQSTRGVHSVAISISGDLPDLLIEDIGRHNAVDKMIGHGFLKGLDFSQAILLSTGRTTSEILHKVKRAGIPIALSRGAPTHQTLLLAREMGVTVASFRSGGITAYSGLERIVSNK